MPRRPRDRVSGQRSGLLAWCAFIAGLAALGVGPTARVADASGGGPQKTTCADLCPNQPDPCVVNATVNVIPGSVIDCGTRAVQVTGGDLLIHDGVFTLKAGSLLVSGRSITADCPQATAPIRFSVDVTGAITVSTAARMQANCDVRGGEIALRAGTDVTIGGLGIQANGTAPNAAGGSVKIDARGNFSSSVGIEAQSTATIGSASGGRIDVKGATAVVTGGLIASSNTGNGGSIAISSTGSLTVSGAGQLDATGGNGDGGDVALNAKGAIQSSRRIQVRGASQTAAGGIVDIDGETVTVNASIISSGGTGGGQITLSSRGGRLEVATGASDAVDLDVTRSGNQSSEGGVVHLHSAGNDVVLASLAHLDASGAGANGVGGTIDVAGATVSAASGSRLIADGPANGVGGTILVESRETMSLSGDVHANNGGTITLLYRGTAPSTGSGVVCPCTVIEDQSFQPPCGDGIRRASVEACDGGDLDGETCTSRGLPSGDLRCSPTCAFDTTGCTGG